MEIVYAPQALEDLEFWARTSNQSILDRIVKLLYSMQETPFSGIGKPECLKHEWSGYWSRRITKEHRIIYKFADGQIVVAQLRHHY